MRRILTREEREGEARSCESNWSVGGISYSAVVDSKKRQRLACAEEGEPLVSISAERMGGEVEWRLLMRLKE